ncbi:MAG: 50S ribosomal protein L9 [Synechococcales cyanobacterium CRU_2_2]|nr:50S ribosomal protein L9 [Synechococcales cyanobacterium CRU_2_2]
MPKRVQVVLTQEIRKLGRDGDLVEVAPGFARNYLFPQGMAQLATPGVLKQVEFRRAKEIERLAAEKEAAEKQKTALATIGRFTIKKQVGEDQAIFGTVTNADVADVIKEMANIELDRRDIEVPEISRLGDYTIPVKLHPEVTADVNIRVAAL